MKTIYAQKKMFLFMNFFSIFFVVAGLYGGIAVDKSFFYILFISLGLSALSMLFLINKIYYDENKIEFSFIYRKLTIKYEDIKEIFVQYDFITGAKIIFNLEKKTDRDCSNYFEYNKICKKENIKTLFLLLEFLKKN